LAISEIAQLFANVNNLPDENMTVVDFVCWTATKQAIQNDLLSFTDEIGYVGMGLLPSLPQQVELICSLKHRVTADTCEKWCIVPSEWWSQLVVALNPNSPSTVPALDNTKIIENARPNVRRTALIFHYVLGRRRAQRGRSS
jgi:hypothetical protein